MYHRPRDANRELDVHPFAYVSGWPCGGCVDEFGYFRYKHTDRDFGGELALYRLGGEPCQCIKDWRVWCGKVPYVTVDELSFLRLGLTRRRRLPRLHVDPTWDVDHARLTIVDILRRRGWPVLSKFESWAPSEFYQQEVAGAYGVEGAYGVVPLNNWAELKSMVAVSAESEQYYVGIQANLSPSTFTIYRNYGSGKSAAVLRRIPAGIAQAVVLLEAYFLFVRHRRVHILAYGERSRRGTAIATRYLTDHQRGCISADDSHFIATSLMAGVPWAKLRRDLVARSKHCFPPVGWTTASTRSADVPPTA
jgi:hypothetical protein